MKKLINIVLLLFMIVGSVQTASAKNWFGNHNRYGSGWGYSGNDCNDWPEWTPMYWMEKMSDDKPDCDDLRNAYFNRYRFQSVYPQAGAGLYPASPYGVNNTANRFPTNSGLYPPLSGRIGRYGSTVPPFAYRQIPSYGATPGLGRMPFAPTYAPPYASSFASPFPPLAGLGSYPGINNSMSSFPPVSPLSSFSLISSPMVGGLSGFGSPMLPVSPVFPWSMGSPLGGGMGFPGMSPMSGGGFGSPWNRFGGSGFSPFR